MPRLKTKHRATKFNKGVRPGAPLLEVVVTRLRPIDIEFLKAFAETHRLPLSELIRNSVARIVVPALRGDAKTYANLEPLQYDGDSRCQIL